MNKDNAKFYQHLVNALAEGKTIQLRCVDEWLDLKECDFSAPAADYRIKPEPREIWVNHYTDSRFDTGPYISEEGAKRLANAGATQVRYREVIE